MENIDIIDLKRITRENEASEEDFKTLADQFETKLKDVGFVYLLNHGIAPEIFDEALMASTDYFNLPEDVKKLDSIGHGPEFQGWVASGREVFNQNKQVSKLLAVAIPSNLKSRE